MCNDNKHECQCTNELKAKLDQRGRITYGVQRKRLHRYRHVMCMENVGCIKKHWSLEVDENCGRGRHQKTWVKMKTGLKRLNFLKSELTNNLKEWLRAMPEDTHPNPCNRDKIYVKLVVMKEVGHQHNFMATFPCLGQKTFLLPILITCFQANWYFSMTKHLSMEDWK